MICPIPKNSMGEKNWSRLGRCRINLNHIVHKLISSGEDPQFVRETQSSARCVSLNEEKLKRRGGMMFSRGHCKIKAYQLRWEFQLAKWS